MINNQILNHGFSMKINFNLKPIGGSKSQIWLSTTINKQRVRIYTRLLIEPQYWIKSDRSNIGGGMADENPSYGRTVLRHCKEVNKGLKNILNFCNEYGVEVSSLNLQTNQTTALEHSPQNFKTYLEARICGTVNDIHKNTQSYIEEYIRHKATLTNKTTGKRISAGTITNHRIALKRLMAYTAKKGVRLTWEIFNKQFEAGFTAWMMEQDFTPNTIATQYSVMKVWLTDAEEKGLITDKAFHHYSTKCYDVENIYLTEEEIQRLYNLDVTPLEINSQSKVEETRDLFIVGCWTGLRYSDYSRMPTLNEERDTVTVHTQKTAKTIEIPLHPMVKAIYKKYGGQLPKPIDKGKAMKNLRLCAKQAGITETTSLRTIKGGREAIRTAEKWMFLKNHTARRSFATNMYLRKLPTITIMAITGHTTEANFMKYIKVSQSEHARMLADTFSHEV